MKIESEKSGLVGVLGLGLIGSVWATHFHTAGKLAACWNRTPQPAFPRVVSTAREVAEKADVLILVMADAAAVKSVVTSLLPALGPRHLVIQSSTIGVHETGAIRALVNGAGAQYLEAPFTGSKPAAEQKKVVFYLGGAPSMVARAQPVLQLISADRIHCGTEEQACTIKLAMNLQIATLAEALCEALYTARKAGLSDDLFFQCMRGNASWSGLAALKEPKLRAENYEPQFSVKHLLKDVRLFRDAAGALPACALLIERLEAMQEAGLGDEDFIALYKGIS